MHPNWRALATLHIPLKRFVSQGATVEEPSSSSYKEKYQVANINATEVNEFYQEIINAPETARRPVVDVAKKTNSRPEQPKVPFDQKKFFRAAMTNDADTIHLFEFRGNEINSKDSFGWTALMMAACEGATDAVEALISLGGDIEAKDKSGNTAYSLAKKKHFFKILEILSRCTEGPIEVEDDFEEEDQNVVQKEFFCDVCRRKFQETSLRDHVTSTVHQFNLKRDKQTKNRFSIPSKNRGLKIMLKQGWDKESGLGPTNTGRLFPVKTVIRKPRTGLGTQQEPARVTHFGEYDLRAIKYVERPKTKNRNDIRREWNSNGSVNEDYEKNSPRQVTDIFSRLPLQIAVNLRMAKSDEEKITEIITATEEVADEILVNKQELVELDKRRQYTREAIREIEKNCSDEKKMWVTVGSMLIKMKRDLALDLLKKDQVVIEAEINKIRSDQKILLNKHRDLEQLSPYSGTNLKPMNRKDFDALKANLPFL